MNSSTLESDGVSFCFSEDLGRAAEGSFGYGDSLWFADFHDDVSDAGVYQSVVDWTAQIRMTQIPFRYYKEFFSQKDDRELVEYAITGGVPKYIELFSESGDIYKAIQRNVLNPSGYLYDEPNFLLQQEVSEIGSYFSVIKTMAAEIISFLRLQRCWKSKEANLTRYLQTLIDLDILERESG